jgi:hypothetical protein
MNPGYVYVPYVISTVAATVSGFTPNKNIRSRYSVRGYWTKQYNRMSKIKKILSIES